MTTFTAPPTQTGLVLNSGDTLNVNIHGIAVKTTINDGGLENVLGGGRAEFTTINAGGVERLSATP